VWGAFIRFSLLTSSFARRSDSPLSSRTSFCLSDTHGPRVPALVERTFPCTYEPDTLIRPPARGDLPARAVVKSSIRRARNKKVYAGLCRTLVSLRSGLLVSTKRVEPPRERVAVNDNSDRIAFPSRLRCWRDATGATSPFLRITRSSLVASWSPRRTSGCFPRNGRRVHRQARRRMCAGKIRMRAGRSCFHIQPVKPSWFWSRKYASTWPRGARSSRRTKLEPVEPTPNRPAVVFARALVIGRNPIHALFNSRRSRRLSRPRSILRRLVGAEKWIRRHHQVFPATHAVTELGEMPCLHRP
jgi:hypothetical protein